MAGTKLIEIVFLILLRFTESFVSPKTTTKQSVVRLRAYT